MKNVLARKLMKIADEIGVDEGKDSASVDAGYKVCKEAVSVLQDVSALCGRMFGIGNTIVDNILRYADKRYGYRDMFKSEEDLNNHRRIMSSIEQSFSYARGKYGDILDWVAYVENEESRVEWTMKSDDVEESEEELYIEGVGGYLTEKVGYIIRDLNVFISNVKSLLKSIDELGDVWRRYNLGVSVEKMSVMCGTIEDKASGFETLVDKIEALQL